MCPIGLTLYCLNRCHFWGVAFISLFLSLNPEQCTWGSHIFTRQALTSPTITQASQGTFGPSSGNPVFSVNQAKFHKLAQWILLLLGTGKRVFKDRKASYSDYWKFCYLIFGPSIAQTLSNVFGIATRGKKYL